MKLYFSIVFLFSASFSISQKITPKTNFSIYEGTIIIGYVDNGAFINFTGPNVNIKSNHSKFTLGMLPSLRLKKDEEVPKNSFITPNLGIGITYSYKNIAIQIPAYYNSKSNTKDGKWHLGIGLGYSFFIKH